MNCTVNVGLGWVGLVVLHYMGGYVCIECPVLVWHYIGICLFGYSRYMVAASVVLYFLEVYYMFYLHSLRCSIWIWCWILGIYEFLGLLYCVC
jgi:hypothetical protein